MRPAALALALLLGGPWGVAAQSRVEPPHAAVHPAVPSAEGEPLTGPAAIALADSLLLAESIEASLHVLEAGLERDTADFELRWRAARAAVYLGSLAIGTDDENRWFRRAIVHVDRALQARPDDRETIHWALAAKGGVAVQTGLRESARLGGDVWDLAHHVLELAPEDPEAHYALGKLEYELLKLNAVQRALSRPFRRGELAHLNWEDALAYGQRAVELDPNRPLFRVGLAETLWRMDRKAEAIAQLELASELPPRTPLDRDSRNRAAMLLERVAAGIDPTR